MAEFIPINTYLAHFETAPGNKPKGLFGFLREKKVYLVRDDNQIWGIKSLNIFERIARLFGAFRETRLSSLVKSVSAEDREDSLYSIIDVLNYNQRLVKGVRALVAAKIAHIITTVLVEQINQKTKVDPNTKAAGVEEVAGEDDVPVEKVTDDEEVTVEEVVAIDKADIGEEVAAIIEVIDEDDVPVEEAKTAVSPPSGVDAIPDIGELMLSRASILSRLSYQDAVTGHTTAGMGSEQFLFGIDDEMRATQMMLKFFQEKPGIIPGFQVDSVLSCPLGSSLLFIGKWKHPKDGSDSSPIPAVLKISRYTQITTTLTTDDSIEVQHPNIIKPLAVYELKGRKVLVLPLAEETVVNRGQKLDALTATKYAVQIAEALSALHAQNYCHLNLKSDHALVFQNGEVKLTGFSLSKKIDSDKSLPIPCSGTPGYMAPEAYCPATLAKRTLKGDFKKLDVFAFGCLIYEMLSGHPPLHEQAYGGDLPWDIQRWANNIRGQSERFTPKIDRTVDGYDAKLNGLAAIVDKCCNYHPLDRPSMEDVLAELITVLQDLTTD